MAKLDIRIAGGQQHNFRVTADGVPVRMKRNRYGNQVGTVETDNPAVGITIETVNELSSPLWLIASVFFFIISIFGIFDVRRTYDKNGRVRRAAFTVGLGTAENAVRFDVAPFREGDAAFSAEAGLPVTTEENIAFTDATLRKRAKILLAVKILLWIALVVGIIAGVLAAVL